MPYIEDLKTSLIEAQKAKDSSRVETLRGILASIHNEEISKRTKGADPELSEDEVLVVLQKEAKKRKEAAQIYKDANRKDLEDKEREELNLIEEYLPAELERSEIEKIVDDVIAGGANDFGRVMGATMKEAKGRADSGVVTEIVKARLSDTQ